MRELLAKPIVNFDSLPLFRYCICLVSEKQSGSQKGRTSVCCVKRLQFNLGLLPDAVLVFVFGCF